jgi:hypothetical protein
MKQCILSALALCWLIGAPACGGDDDSCDPRAQTGCEDGEVCEEVVGGDPACFGPLVVRGSVFDIEDASPIAEARIVAQDANGAAVSSVAISDEAGEYGFAVPTPRTEDGAPASPPTITLRADAAGYQAFPGGVRLALPIDTNVATAEEGALVIESSLTDIALIALPEAAGQAAMSGAIELPEERVGILVVAEGGGQAYSAIADRDGNYAFLNLPDGVYTVTAYAQGANYEPVEVSVAAGETGLDVDTLALSEAEPSTVTGKVEIVNPGEGTDTSVIMVVASTFNEATGRGEAVPGLRAADVSGSFEIDGVPAGTYVFLAAFENDYLVRDPDTCIGGTDLVTRAIEEGVTADIEDSFKVTGALDVVSPGAAFADMVSATPSFTWIDDSSEDAYRLVVLDSFGELVWETVAPGESGDDPLVTYDGPALQSGMYYQFRATSVRTSGGGTCEISRTEDLKGVFFVE